MSKKVPHDKLKHYRELKTKTLSMQISTFHDQVLHKTLVDENDKPILDEDGKSTQSLRAYGRDGKFRFKNTTAAKMDKDKALKLCQKYKREIDRWKENYTSVSLEFDELIKNPVGSTQKIIDGFDLGIELNDDIKDSIIEWIDPDLKHHNIKK